MYSQVMNDIRFDDASRPSKINKEELLNTLQDDNIDKSLIKQIKGSFYDNVSTNSSSLSNLDAIDQQINSLNNTKEENMYNSPTSINTISNDSSKNLSEQTGLSNILKKNINKVVNGIRIFKNNKKNDGNNLSSSSSSSSSYNDSILTINTFEKKEVLSLKEPNDNILLNISEQNIKRHHNSYSSSYSSDSYNTNIERNKPISSEDEEELQRTLSSEHIFMEISNQCLEITSPINSKNIEEAINSLETGIIEELINEAITYETISNEIISNEIISNETPINETPINETPINETPINETPINETPINEEESNIEEKQSDDSVSVITIDTFIDQKDDETSKEIEQKKKRQYKPRKNKNI
jgi:hypothetical protein